MTEKQYDDLNGFVGELEYADLAYILNAGLVKKAPSVLGAEVQEQFANAKAFQKAIVKIGKQIEKAARKALAKEDSRRAKESNQEVQA